MGSCTSSQAQAAQENARELAEKIGILRDGQKMDMRSLVMLMWKAREHPKLVEILSTLVATHADEKAVFDGIEFYLPQLVHMILHLEMEWKTNFLEQFSLLISQHSLHLALQMYWILVAAMQDYQPEDDEGMPNKSSNPELFVRCAALQASLEKSVVFGSPNCGQLEKQFTQGKLTKEKLQELTLQDRLDAATQFIKEEKETGFVMEGELMYKRWKRTSKFASKGWSRKHFKVQNRILICYDQGKMVRAIPLAHTKIEQVKNDKYDNYFEVQEQNRERVWKMRALNANDLKKWVDVLRSESLAPPPPTKGAARLTESQIARYGFYRSERDFVRDLTDICEDLRFVKIPERKPALRAHLEKLDVPGCVYLPMTKSTAKWQRVIRVLPEKGHPFSTRARCPCLMTFEVQGDGDVDLANYLYQTLDQSVESSEGRRGFIKSAKLSAMQANPEDASRLQIAFSDAGVPPVGVEDINEHSLWAEETSPGDGKSGKRVNLARQQHHTDLGNQALEFLKNVIPGFEPPAPKDSIGSMATAIGQATAETHEEKRTQSVRIQSMKGKVDLSNEPQFGRIIAKSNDDLRQEVFTMQLMQFHKDVWEEQNIPLYLRTYRILSTSKNTGLLEVITNADSIDGVKKKLVEKDAKNNRFILKFKELFPDPDEFKLCQRRYMESLAGSSIVSYILRTGDRHNGNIMVEMETGRLAHIDFGFVFGMRPGKDKIPHTDFSFERAAFKLTNEMVEVFGGKGSELWKEFIRIMTEGFLAIRAKADVLITLVEIMGYRSMFPCFRQPGGGVKRVIRELKERLMVNVPDSQIPKRIEYLATSSLQARGTILYEMFQENSNGIAPIY